MQGMVFPGVARSGWAGLMFAVCLIALPAGAVAHHGWGGYRSDEPVELTGTVQEVSPGNPHATLRLQTADGVWLITLSPPARMQARGLPASSIRPGDTATVGGHVAVDDPREVRAEWIQVGDTRIPLR